MIFVDEQAISKIWMQLANNGLQNEKENANANKIKFKCICIY